VAGEGGRADFLCEILSVAIVINLAAYVLGHETKNLMAARYLLPAFIFGAILAGRLGVDGVVGSPRLDLGAAVLAVAYLALFGKAVLAPPGSDPYGFTRLAEWLSSRNLTYGYGTYWTSSITTVTSANRVKVRAVLPDGGQIRPKLWMSDREWYRDTPARFLVSWANREKDNPNFTIAYQAATDAFGPPSEVARVGEYTVMIWDKDITPCLGPPDEIKSIER
jgi:hypothetical protein